MLTARGWWFLFAVLLQISLGLALSERRTAGMVPIGLALLGWFLYEWLRFYVRARLVLPGLRFERQVRDDHRSVPVLWAGREFQVRLDVYLDADGELPYVILRDRFPAGAELVSGSEEVATSLNNSDVVSIRYRFRTPSAGEIRFDGLRVRVADLQGFFYHRAFMRRPEVYPVLPQLTDAEGKRRGSKSHNILPPPGVHRLRQPGGGSELLDLRDYRPGDPPKMIAWKPSARRDRLITKEFETEVPLRCTLFLDASQPVRLGPARRTQLAQLVTIASGVSQAAISDRDHVGLVVFDEAKAEILTPARTSRHLILLLHKLADAARRQPMHVKSDVDMLLRVGMTLAYDVYPDLLRRDRNRLPWSMFWEPLLDSRWGWWVIVLLLSPLLMLWAPAAGVVGGIARAITGYEGGFWLVVFLIVLLPPLVGALIWLGRGLRGHLPPWNTRKMRRKRLAAILCALDNSPPGELTRLTMDDEYFAGRLQEWLAEHHVRYPVELYDARGRYLFRGSGKVDVLARALNRAILRAHDNELFVLLADLIELDDELDPLLRAVKVAMARHHHVLVVCPWLPDIPPPDERMGGEEPEREEVRAIQTRIIEQGYRGVEAELMFNLVMRYRRAYIRVRRAFGRLGVLVTRADEGEPVELILNRLDRLRGVRRRR